MTQDQPGDKPPAALEALEARLLKARGQQRTETSRGPGQRAPLTGFGMAMRVGVEMVSALAVGAGMGILIDKGFDTAPWGMVLFFFLGAAAGFVNVYRALKGIGLAAGYSGPVEEEKDKTRNKGPEC